MARPTLLSLLALASLLAPAAGVAGMPLPDPSGTPSQLDESKFLVATGAPDSVDFVVPAQARVSFTLHVRAGTATDFTVEGPGPCQKELASVTAGPLLPQTVRVDCGILNPMKGKLVLGVTAGALRGTIDSFGADIVA